MKTRNISNSNKIKFKYQFNLIDKSVIRVNDVFDELVHQNRDLEKQIKFFIEFKVFFDEIVNKLYSHLNESELDQFKTFDNRFKQVFDVKTVVKKEVKSDINSIKDDFNSKEKVSKGKQIGIKNGRKRYKSGDLFQCPDCTRRFIQEDKLKEHHKIFHQLKDSGPLICDFIGCGQEFKNKTVLYSHKEIHSGKEVFKCDFNSCDYQTCNRRYFQTHRKRHILGKRYVCDGTDGCQKRFFWEKELEEHIELHHEIRDKSYNCSVDGCSKSFKTEKSLKLHVNNVHTFREKKVYCDIPGCQFQTHTRFFLLAHKNHIHSDNRPFICSVRGCGKRFKSSGNLCSHRMSHSVDRPFKCTQTDCQKTFKNFNCLKRHIESHSSERIGCDWPGCEFTTNTEFKIKSHYMVHKTERKFACLWPGCGKTFKQSKYLAIHLDIHKNDKRFVCGWPGCQYRCCVKSNLLKHEKIHSK